MSLFEFLMVLVSIIIGLGLAEVLTGVARMIRSRGSIATYWVHALGVCMIFAALLQQWWLLHAVLIPAFSAPLLWDILDGPSRSASASAGCGVRVTAHCAALQELGAIRSRTRCMNHHW